MGEYLSGEYYTKKGRVKKVGTGYIGPIPAGQLSKDNRQQ